MKVIRARTAGFCMGVSLALRRLDRSLAGIREGRLITLGPIIHNPRVMRAYEAAGVICLTDEREVRAGDTVLVRAHGITREVEERLTASGAVVVDATCPKVKTAQLAIATERARSGGTMLLFGEADHPEVRGLVSYADNQAMVFGSESEFDTLKLDTGSVYFLAAQTTQDQEEFARLTRRAASKLGHDLPILSTICDATRKRQEEVLRLAGLVDGIVVVGGKNSGNTRRLADIATAQGKPVLHVEDADEIEPQAVAGWRLAGLTAGASTPAAHIDAVQMVIEAL